MHRAVLILFTLSLSLWLPQGNAAVVVSSSRVWSAQDYTRLTLESKKAIHHNMFNLSNPDRLVIDLEGVSLGKTLKDLSTLIGNDDPYIKNIRVGRFKPGVVRLVLDLKAEVKPQLFVLKPVAEYGYRLVLDVYPAHPVDPLMALIEQPKASVNETGDAATATSHPAEKTPATSEDEQSMAQNTSIDESGRTIPSTSRNLSEMRARTLIIAIDAGHGGEDPGQYQIG